MRKKQKRASVDDFLKKEGIFDKTQPQAIRDLEAWHLAHDKPFWRTYERSLANQWHRSARVKEI